MQIGDLPALLEKLADLLPVFEALADRVLVRTGKRGEDQISGVGVARMHLDSGVAFNDPHDLREVAEIESGLDAA